MQVSPCVHFPPSTAWQCDPSYMLECIIRWRKLTDYTSRRYSEILACFAQAAYQKLIDTTMSHQLLLIRDKDKTLHFISLLFFASIANFKIKLSTLSQKTTLIMVKKKYFFEHATKDVTYLFFSLTRGRCFISIKS